MKTLLLFLATVAPLLVPVVAHATLLEDAACNLVSQNVSRFLPDGSVELDPDQPGAFIDTVNRLQTSLESSTGTQLLEFTQMREVKPQVSQTIFEYHGDKAVNLMGALDPSILVPPRRSSVFLNLYLGSVGTLTVLAHVLFPKFSHLSDTGAVMMTLASAVGWLDFAAESSARATSKKFREFEESFLNSADQKAHTLTLHTRGPKSLGDQRRFVDLTLIHYPFGGTKSLIVSIRTYSSKQALYSPRGEEYYAPVTIDDYGTLKPDQDLDGIPDDADKDNSVSWSPKTPGDAGSKAAQG